jgi:hypothetical protein
MKERPILFSNAMVAAIIADSKTQTRRAKGLEVINQSPDDWHFSNCTASDGDFKQFLFNHNWYIDTIELIKCPHGKTGDLLYVREAWRLIGWDFEDGTMLIEYKDGVKLWMPIHDPTDDGKWLVDQVEKLWLKGCLGEDPEDPDKAVIIKTVPWRPSIHMPKAAARLSLLLEYIGAERLQDISEADAFAEGTTDIQPIPGGYRLPDSQDFDPLKSSYKTGFEYIWIKINGQDSWNINPWVWTLKFKELSKEGRPNV